MMFVVVVEFTAHAQHAGAFRERVLRQASDSLRLETGCRQFDVCVDRRRPEFVLLYEVYADRDAFDAHLASPHFADFDASVGAWIADKKVMTFERLEAG